MLEKPFIALITDFGLKDPFVGLMKGVILKINPNVRIIDITHHIQRHNIFEASQVLAMSYKYFPPATIFVVVVDPGVGSERRPILVITEDYYFVGPDNGVFTTIYEHSKNGFLKVLHITADHFFLPMSGSTFHGRDVFAPVAGWLSKGIESNSFGEEINDYKRLDIPLPEISEEMITGEIVCIDYFGNAITNISKDDLLKIVDLNSLHNIKIRFRDQILSIVNYYEEASDGQIAGIINSFGYIELFVYKGSVSEKFNIQIGEKISISRH